MARIKGVKREELGDKRYATHLMLIRTRVGEDVKLQRVFVEGRHITIHLKSMQAVPTVKAIRVVDLTNKRARPKRF